MSVKRETNKDVVHIRNRIKKDLFIPAMQKNETPSAATWMVQELIILSAKTNIMLSFKCGILKNHTNELIHKTETNSQTLKTSLWLQKWKGVGEGWIGICTLLYMECMVNRDLQYSTGNSAHYSVMT